MIIMALEGEMRFFRSEREVPTQNEFEDATIISRLACIVAKEEPIQRMLRLIQKHRYGIPTKELVRIITVWRYRQTLINQAIYFGLLSQTKKVYSESENDSLYHLTERGSKVLIACKNLYHSK